MYNFSLRNASATKLWFHIQYNLSYKILLVTLCTKRMRSKHLFQNIFILRWLRVANFADIIKIVTTVIKAILKDLKRVKINRNDVPKRNLYLYFLIQQKLLISGEKMPLSAEPKWFASWFTYAFGSFLGKVTMYKVSSL